MDIPTAEKMMSQFDLPLLRVIAPLAGGTINRSSLIHLSDEGVWICRVDVEGGRGKLAHEAAVYRWLWARAPGLPIAMGYHLVPGFADLIAAQPG